jgi:hypothetical protein
MQDRVANGVASELEIEIGIYPLQKGVLKNIISHVGCNSNVASELELDEEVCGMHDTDKLGPSTTRQLVHSRNKQVVIPFREEVGLMKKANTMGTYFSYGKRHE